MDQILDTVMEVFAKRADPYLLATAVIKRKAAEEGLILSKRHLRKVEAALRGQNVPDFVVRMPGKGPKREFKIQLNAQDLQEIEGKVQSLLDRLPALMGELIELTTDDLLRTLKRTWRREARRQEREHRRLGTTLRKRWEYPLELLAMIITIAGEKGAEINDTLRSEADPKVAYSDEALTRLHARSCQVASEVLTLLREGFADGALARWRTQHEISVVARFIRENGDGCAERYLAHSVVESYRAAIQYQRHCSALGYEPFGKTEMQQFSDGRKAALQKYGPEFDDDYGWAAPVLKVGKPTFAALEDSIEVSHLRPYYKMASQNVHATAKGIQFALGLIGDEGILLAGPSDIGLADPGQLSALALVQTTITLLTLTTTLDNAVASKVLLALAGEAAEAFCAVETSPDDSPVEPTHS